MKVRKSRLLSRLEADIASATNPIEADCHRARRALYLARQGDNGAVQQVLKELHLRYDARPRAVISSWIHLVEGVANHLNDTGHESLDKLKRALAISSAANLTELHALSAAWLAHIHYTSLELEAMSLNVKEALRLAKAEHHSVLSRASLVIGQALHLADRLDLANPWYARVRMHANAEGDDSALSAWFHNSAWLRMSSLRQAVLFGKQDVAGGEHALSSAKSLDEFDKLVGASSWDAQRPILHAQILSLEGDAAGALALYEQYMPRMHTDAPARLRANWLADLAWCRVQSGLTEGARDAGVLALESLDASSQADDRAAAHSRLHQVFAALGDPASAASHEAMAVEAWTRHGKTQARIVELLGDVAEPSPQAQA